MSENGEFFLIYTTESGGFYKTPLTGGKVQRFTREQYEEIKRTREFTYNAEPWAEVPRMVTEIPHFIALARVEDNHDFLLGRSRDEVAA